MSKARRWCGTSFEVSEEFEGECANKLKMLSDLPSVTYCAWQLERCPTSNKLHYQWYMEFKNAMGWGPCKKVFGDSAHIEKCRGTPDENDRYVTKRESHVGGPWIHGVKSDGQGARTDLKAHVASLKQLAQEGYDANCAFALACDKNPDVFRFSGSARMLVTGWRSLNNPKVTKERKLIIRCGAAGAGKSLGITERFGEDSLYRHPGGEWFDGYYGQPVCVIDDVSMDWFIRHIADIKRWTDWSPVQVPVKGAYVWNGWDYLAITSNDPIHRLVMADDGLQRRCSEVTFFEKDGKTFRQIDLLANGNEVVR